MARISRSFALSYFMERTSGVGLSGTAQTVTEETELCNRRLLGLPSGNRPCHLKQFAFGQVGTVYSERKQVVTVDEQEQFCQLANAWMTIFVRGIAGWVRAF